jgi:hypothetical protein
MADGSIKAAVDPVKVLNALKSGREEALRDLSPPFNCKVGERVEGKYFFLPHGTDPRAITAMKVSINGKERDVIGSFMDAPQRAAFMRASSLRAGATTGAGASAGATSQPNAEIIR